MQEFINLHQGDMSVKEYSLKFTQLSKHASTMVENSRAKMNKFVMGIYDLVVNECSSAMLILCMHIPYFMVHAKQIEEQKLKQVGRELKKVRTEYENSTKTRFEVQDKPRFKKRFSNQGPSSSPRVNKSKVTIPKPHEGKGGGSYVLMPLCSKCGRKHDGKGLVGRVISMVVERVVT